MSKVTGADFQNALVEVIGEYNAEIRRELNALAARKGRELVKAIKENAQFKTGSGTQKKSWKIAENTYSGIDRNYIIHSTDYRKTHLLENGHLTRAGTKRVNTKAYHFIANAVRDVLGSYEQEVQDTIEGVK